MFTSMDVYDAASSIGREYQLIVGEHGPDVLEKLMPKVVATLEELETCVLYNEKENDEIARLRELVENLRVDCQIQTELKEQSGKNLEQLERSWYCETQQMLQQVTSLEEENSLLAQELVSSVRSHAVDLLGAPDISQSKPTARTVLLDAACGRDVQLPLDTFSVDRQVHSLPLDQTEDSMITSVLSEAEERLNLTEQESRVADLQLIGRLKECASGNYKAIRALNREIMHVGASLDAAEEEVCRLARQSGRLMALRSSHATGVDQLFAIKSSLESRLHAKECELAELRQILFADDVASCVTSESADTFSLPHVLDKVKSIHLSQARNKCTQPSRVPETMDDPVVTLEEWRHALFERNELRCRLLEIEEELSVMEKERSKEPDVQGPVPYEPEEKFRPTRAEKPSIKLMFRQLLRRLTDPALESE